MAISCSMNRSACRIVVGWLTMAARIALPPAIVVREAALRQIDKNDCLLHVVAGAALPEANDVERGGSRELKHQQLAPDAWRPPALRQPCSLPAEGAARAGRDEVCPCDLGPALSPRISCAQGLVRAADVGRRPSGMLDAPFNAFLAACQARARQRQRRGEQAMEAREREPARRPWCRIASSARGGFWVGRMALEPSKSKAAPAAPRRP